MITRTVPLKSLWVVASAALTALVLAACSPFPASPDTAAEAQPLTPLWSTEGGFLTAPRVVGSTVLAITKASADFAWMIAWDAQSGQELWREETVPGREPANRTFKLSVVEHDGKNYVGFLGADGGDVRTAKVIVAEVRTGANLVPEQANASYWSVTYPRECGGSLCLSGGLRNSKGYVDIETQGFRFDFGTKTFLTSAQDPQAPQVGEDGLEVGTEVSLVTKGSPADGDSKELVQSQRAGRTLWTRPYQDVFGPGASTAGGWGWFDGDPGLPVLAYGGIPDKKVQSGPAYSLDLTTLRVVALDRETGRTLWQLQGFRPCFVGDGLTPKDGMLVLCHYVSGRYTSGAEPEDPGQADNVTAAVTRVDAKTGRIDWAYRLGDPLPAMGVARRNNPSLKGYWIDVADGKATRLDLATGKTEAVGEAARFLCWDSGFRTWSMRTPYAGGGRRDFNLERPRRVCTADGTHLDEKGFALQVFRDAGYEDKKYVAVVTDSGLTTFKVP